MNILIDRLPETVDGLRVNTDYRYMVLFELMNQDPQIAQWEAIDRALALFYIDQPTDLDQAVEGMLWFYRCGQDPPKQTEHIGGSRGAQAYSFEQDAAYIYSAFWAQYHLDLQQERMHWWKFRALFSGLYEQVPLTKIMGYRTADTKGMDRGTKAFYNRMKRQYAIETKEMRQQKSYQAYKESMQQYVAKRFAENGM